MAIFDGPRFLSKRQFPYIIEITKQKNSPKVKIFDVQNGTCVTQTITSNDVIAGNSGKHLYRD